MSVADQTSIMPAGKWAVDRARSTVTFAVKHMMFATVNGAFREFDGMLEMRPGAARASGTVEATSIDTGDPVRDERLRGSSDFFEVQRYSQIRFSSNRIEYLGGRRLLLFGNLTIRGVTVQIELQGELRDSTGEAGNEERIELELHGEVNRRDFGITWNETLETGGALLANKVKIALDISAVKSERPSR